MKFLNTTGPEWNTRYAMELDIADLLDKGKSRKEVFEELSPKYNQKDQQVWLAKAVSMVVSNADQAKYAGFKNVFVGLLLIYMVFYPYQPFYFISSLHYTYTRIFAFLVTTLFIVLELYILNYIKRTIIEFEGSMLSFLPFLFIFQAVRVLREISDNEYDEIFFVILFLQAVLLILTIVWRLLVFSHMPFQGVPRKNDAGVYVFKD